MPAGAARAANPGCFVSHVTPMTTSIGIRLIIAYETHVVNPGRGKNETKTSETTITDADAARPSDGCFIPLSPSAAHARRRGGASSPVPLSVSAHCIHGPAAAGEHVPGTSNR